MSVRRQKGWTRMGDTMTRGNQREMDRARAAKKQANKSKTKESNTTLAKRKEADAEILRAKQKKNDEQKAAAETAARTGKTDK